MSRSLAVDAELTLTHDGEEIAVWDSEDALVVDAPSYGAARSLLRTITKSPVPPAELFAAATASSESEVENGSATATAGGPDTVTDETRGPIDTAGDLDLEAALDRHDLTVEIRVRYATVARLGADATPTNLDRWLAPRLLRVPAAVRLRGAVVAAARRVG